jgi:DNA-binding transcriptional ArsR family regulator
VQTVRAATECAAKLRVLGDPTRMRVIEILMDGPRCVHELMSTLRIEQSLLSHHLRVMRNAGLVEGVRAGKAVRYQLAAGAERRAAALDIGCCQIVFETEKGARKR